MTNIQFRKPSELPENPPDGMRIVAKIDQRMLAIQYTHSRLAIEGGIEIYDGDGYYRPDAWVMITVADNAARRHEMNEFGKTILALMLAGF